MHYWIVINDNTLGPLTLEELMQVEGLTPQTPLWFDGLAGWTTIGQVPDLMNRLMQPRQAAVGQMTGSVPPFNTAAPTFNGPMPAHTSGLAPQQAEPVMPPSHLVWAIIVTLCCCLPAGVVAIIYASKVSSLFNAGRYAEAEKASETAMWWVIGGFVLGLVMQPFMTILQLMMM